MVSSGYNVVRQLSDIEARLSLVGIFFSRHSTAKLHPNISLINVVISPTLIDEIGKSPDSVTFELLVI